MARASFTAVGASAGPRVTRVAPQGVSLQGMSRHGVGTPDTFSTSTVQAVAASHAGLSAAAVPRQVELADPHLASTALKREQLTYLVRCALPEDIELYTPQGAERFTFPGRIGLAPRWLSEAMTPSEERWVSACVLAHVNYFGKPVMISLRSGTASRARIAGLRRRATDLLDFRRRLFRQSLHPPSGRPYLSGRARSNTRRIRFLRDRICTRETGATTADGKPVTYCHFIVTGRCEEDSSLTVMASRIPK